MFATLNYLLIIYYKYIMWLRLCTVQHFAKSPRKAIQFITIWIGLYSRACVIASYITVSCHGEYEVHVKTQQIFRFTNHGVIMTESRVTHNSLNAISSPSPSSLNHHHHHHRRHHHHHHHRITIKLSSSLSLSPWLSPGIIIINIITIIIIIIIITIIVARHRHHHQYHHNH